MMEASAGPLTRVEDWEENYEGFIPGPVTKVGYYEIFEQFLSPDPTKTVLEIGGGGGRHLCWLAQKFHFQPFGIDYSETALEKTRATFTANGLPPPALYLADLFTWTPPQLFDLVCSFGFVEHFQNFELVLKKHADLVVPGGLLIFGLPHMAHLNYLFRWLVDRENLQHHNIRIMNLRTIRRSLQALPLDLLYLNYYRTFAFPPPRADLRAHQKAAYYLIYAFGRSVRKLVGRKRPNFLISPKIICVARRRSEGGAS